MALLDKPEDVEDSIRVAVNLVIYVNKKHWDTTYGTGTLAKDVSTDVRMHFAAQVENSRVFEEIDGYVEVKNR